MMSDFVNEIREEILREDEIQRDTERKENAPVENRCYTVQDLQAMLNISRGSVYELLKRKVFHWFQIGNGRYRISKKSFDAWLDGQA